MRDFFIIAAIDQRNGIGKHGSLVWELPSDLRHFKKVTTSVKDAQKKNMVVMGRKTWESIPASFKPLQDRVNVVLTNDDFLNFPGQVIKENSLLSVFGLFDNKSFDNAIESIFIIGGESLFNEALQFEECKEIFMTHILADFDCDQCFPSYHDHFELYSKSEIFQENNLDFYFAFYKRSHARTSP